MYFKNHGNVYANLKYIHVCSCHTTQSRFLAYYLIHNKKGSATCTCTWCIRSTDMYIQNQFNI